MILWETFMESAVEAQVSLDWDKAEELFVSALEEIDSEGCQDVRAVQTLYGLLVSRYQQNQFELEPLLQRLMSLLGPEPVEELDGRVDHLLLLWDLLEKSSALSTLYQKYLAEFRSRAQWMWEHLESRSHQDSSQLAKLAFFIGEEKTAQAQEAEAEDDYRLSLEYDTKGRYSDLARIRLVELLRTHGRWGEMRALLSDLSQNEIELHGLGLPTLEQSVQRRAFFKCLAQMEDWKSAARFLITLESPELWSPEVREDLSTCLAGLVEHAPEELEPYHPAFVKLGLMKPADPAWSCYEQFQAQPNGETAQLLRTAMLENPEVEEHLLLGRIQAWFALADFYPHQDEAAAAVALEHGVEILCHLSAAEQSELRLLQRALQLAQLQINLGAEDPAVLDRAEAGLRKSLTWAEQLGSPTQETVALLVETSQLYALRGRRIQAEGLLKKALLLQEKATAPYHLSLLPLLEKLIAHYCEPKERKQREDMRKKVCAIRGVEYVEELACEELLASSALYLRNEDYTRAEQSLQPLLTWAVPERTDAPRDLDQAQLLSLLADIREAQGQWQDSLEFRRRELTVLRRQGRDQETWPKALFYAEQLLGQGRESEGQQMVRLLFDMPTPVDEADVGRAWKLQAVIWRNQEHFERALDALEQGWRVFAKSLEVGHPDRLETHKARALILSEIGRLPEAHVALQNALAEESEALGEDHPDRAVTLSQIGELFLIEGNYAEAERSFREALELNQRSLEPDHPNIAATRGNLGQTLLNQARFQEAKEQLEDALAIYESGMDEEGPGSIRCRSSLGLVLFKLGELSQALEVLESAQQLAIEQLGSDDLEVAFCAYHLSDVHMAMGNVSAAVSCSQTSLNIRTKVRGRQHPETSQCLLQGSLLLAKVGQPAKALEKAKEAADNQRRALGELHPEMIPALQTLSQIQLTLKLWSEAEATLTSLADIQEHQTTGSTPRILEATLLELLHVQGQLMKTADSQVTAQRIAALEIPEDSSEPLSQRNSVRWTVAQVYIDGQKWKEAETLLRAAVDQSQKAVTAKVEGAERELAIGLSHMGRLYGLQSKWVHSDSLYLKACTTTQADKDLAATLALEWSQLVERSGRTADWAKSQAKLESLGICLAQAAQNQVETAQADAAREAAEAARAAEQATQAEAARAAEEAAQAQAARAAEEAAQAQAARAAEEAAQAQAARAAEEAAQAQAARAAEEAAQAQAARAAEEAAQAQAARAAEEAAQAQAARAAEEAAQAQAARAAEEAAQAEAARAAEEAAQAQAARAAEEAAQAEAARAAEEAAQAEAARAAEEAAQAQAARAAEEAAQAEAARAAEEAAQAEAARAAEEAAQAQAARAAEEAAQAEAARAAEEAAQAEAARAAEEAAQAEAAQAQAARAAEEAAQAQAARAAAEAAPFNSAEIPADDAGLLPTSASFEFIPAISVEMAAVVESPPTVEEPAVDPAAELVPELSHFLAEIRLGSEQGLSLDYQQLLERIRSFPREDSPLYFEAYQTIAAGLSEQGHLREAVACREEILALVVELKGAEHEDVLSALTDLGRLCLAPELLPKAEKAWMRLTELGGKLKGPTSPEVGRGLLGLGRCYVALKHPQAFPILSKALKTLHANGPVCVDDLSIAHYELGVFLISQGKEAEALAQFKSYHQLRERLRLFDKPDLGRLKAILQVSFRQGDIDFTTRLLLTRVGIEGYQTNIHDAQITVLVEKLEAAGQAATALHLLDLALVDQPGPPVQLRERSHDVQDAFLKRALGLAEQCHEPREAYSRVLLESQYGQPVREASQLHWAFHTVERLYLLDEGAPDRELLVKFGEWLDLTARSGAALAALEVASKGSLQRYSDWVQQELTRLERPSQPETTQSTPVEEPAPPQSTAPEVVEVPTPISPDPVVQIEEAPPSSPEPEPAVVEPPPQPQAAAEPSDKDGEIEALSSVGPEGQARLLFEDARKLVQHGDSRQALEMFEKTLSMLADAGCNDPSLLSSVHFHMGKASQVQKQYPSAEQSLRKAFDIRNQRLGPDHEQTLEVLIAQADCFRLQRKFEMAESFLLRVIEIRKKRTPGGAPDRALYESYLSLAQIKVGQKNYESALEILQRCAPGTGKLDLSSGGAGEFEIRSLLAVAQIRLQQLRYDEAREVLNQTENILAASPAKEHELWRELLWDTRSAVAHILLLQDRFHESEPYCRASYDLVRQYESPVALARTQVLLAQSLARLSVMELRNLRLDANTAYLSPAPWVSGQSDVGKLEESRMLYEAALAGLWNLFGEENVEVANCLEGLARVEIALGRWDDAEERLSRALLIKETVLGNTHPSTAEPLRVLAALYELDFRYDLAESTHKRVLETCSKSMGSDHPALAICMESLSNTYYLQGRYQAAQSLYERALDVVERLLGADHPQKIPSLIGLAKIHLQQSLLSQADQCASTAKRLAERYSGHDSIEYAEALHVLGDVCRTSGRFSEARNAYQDSMKIRHKYLGQNHVKVAESLLSIGLLSQDLGQLDVSERFLTKAIQTFESQLGPNHPQVADTLQSLGILYRAVGKGANSELFLKRSMEIRTRTLGTEHPDISNSLFSLGQLYLDLRNDSAAEALLLRGLEIREQVFRSDHPGIAAIQVILARMYRSQEKYAEAEPYFRRVLEHREKTFGNQHQETAVLIRELAELAQLRGQRAQAESMHRQALDILEKRMGPTHPTLLPSLYSMIELYRSAGLSEEVAKYEARVAEIENSRS